jgi:hypothetical protein
MITGLTKGRSIEILRQIPYPESEWPEIGSIRGAKEMHQALYDIWQTSDELEAEHKRAGKGGLLFHTPFGDFVTVGVHVVPAEDAEEARAADKAQKECIAEIGRIEREVMASHGFGPKRMKEITDRYGGRFADWPEDIRKAYWTAYHAAGEASEAVPGRRSGRVTGDG